MEEKISWLDPWIIWVKDLKDWPEEKLFHSGGMKKVLNWRQFLHGGKKKIEWIWKKLRSMKLYSLIEEKLTQTISLNEIKKYLRQIKKSLCQYLLLLYLTERIKILSEIKILCEENIFFTESKIYFNQIIFGLSEINEKNSVNKLESWVKEILLSLNLKFIWAK